MTKVRSKVVAVTGAASGIGRALALALVGKGAEVAISDVDEVGLAETEKLLAGKGKVTSHVLDVRDREAWARYAAAVEGQHGGADIIINNAGVAVRASVEEISYEDFEFVMDVNFWGVVYGTKTFLPLFRRRGAGHIVNISSINGLVPFALQSPYNASKFGVLGFNETLMQELAEDPIRVTSVHPGGIRTNIARRGRNVSEEQAAFFDTIARTSADEAAAQIVRGIEADRQRVYVGADAKLMATAKRLVPAFTVNLFGRVSRGWANKAALRPAGRTEP
jgi:NAD(P)-dependent dehydrogenase (short-subunit alcohol dehydrogenase family)